MKKPSTLHTPVSVSSTLHLWVHRAPHPQPGRSVLRPLPPATPASFLGILGWRSLLPGVWALPLPFPLPMYPLQFNSVLPPLVTSASPPLS